MRRWRVLFAALVVLSLLVVQTMPAAADPEDEQRLAQLAREKQELERAIQVSRQNAERYRQEANRFQAAVDSANARIAQLSQEQARAQNEADALRIDIAIAEEQLALVAFQLNETQALIGSLKAQAAEQTKQLGKREEIYAIHLRTTYVQSRVSPLEMLLSSRSLADFVNRVQALILIDRQDKQIVGEMKALQTSTAKKQDDVAQKETEIAGLQAQITSQRASLAKKKADYEEIVRAKAASIVSQDGLRYDAAVNRNSAVGATQQANAEAASLNRRLEQTEAAYAALAAQLAARSGLAVFTGRMVVWPVAGVVTSRFGARWGGFHNGLDIAAPMYTPVKAGAAGQVVTVGKPYLAYGDTATVVIIAHGSNFSTLYGHLDDRTRPPVVRVGQFVTAGTTIAYVGMTGWTTGPHAHFMTIVNGRAVDPAGYLP
ncbi:MAG: peptidoglycan DD-metalloendopeptidase family protein [Chloroflexi bacterium]|nr:peptidoglycan DD-metalloendopeptidase family protein [Chloroflexota bacterium]